MDLNIHNSVKENYQSGENGELLHEWFTLRNLELIYNAEDKGTFRSRKGEKTTHPKEHKLENILRWLNYCDKVYTTGFSP